MLDIRREYEALNKRLTRYKTKPLGFEYGCLCGKVTKINLIRIKDNTSWKGYSEAIEVVGVTLSDKEHRLMVLTEDSVKGKDYKYWWEYHILEKFNQETPYFLLYIYYIMF